MQRALRMNDGQLLSLSEKAIHDNCLRGYLCKRTADSARWQLRWFVLYQNLLFYYESDSAARPSGVLFLEGSYCERLLTPVTGKNTGSTQVIRQPGSSLEQFYLLPYRQPNSSRLLQLRQI